MTRPTLLQPEVHDGDHAMGLPDAPVTLVEYGDYQCPFCGRAHPVVRRLQERFGAQLRFVFRNFPLSEIHPDARRAAEAAESVNAQRGATAFWEMHHSIFLHLREGIDAFSETRLLDYATALGASAAQVRNDIEQQAFETRIHEDFLSGIRSGVNGTPTFFINGGRVEGDWTDERAFNEAIEDALNVHEGEASIR